jgi:uncharacterized membrane protein YsdA (DUF1294 family)
MRLKDRKQPARQRAKASPMLPCTLAALVLSAGGAAAIYVVLSWPAPAANLSTALLFAADKMQAKAGGTRVPEKVLHTLVLLGGTAGGLASMLLFQHKIRKARFQAVYWSIVILQAGSIAVWAILK